MRVLMILHLLSEESGFYEERPKRPKTSNPYIPRIPRDQDRNPRLSFDRQESASMVEALDVVTSEWKSLSSNAHARMNGNAKGYSPRPFAEQKKGSLLNPIPMFSDWAHRRQGKMTVLSVAYTKSLEPHHPGSIHP